MDELIHKPRIVVLGSTGSIGTQTLEVCERLDFTVTGLAAGRNLERLSQQIRKFGPKRVSAYPEILSELRHRFPLLELSAEAGEVAELPAEVYMAAIPGLAGLTSTRVAARQGTRVALANKESMVAAGPLLWAELRAHGSELLPVDSEHSALFQALVGERKEVVQALILTASGGPFREQPKTLEQVTPEMALKHPRWRMGKKVTIDSATLMNKGLEVLEAMQIFELPLSRIHVAIHPQSYIHGMVRFTDGQIKALLGPTDMRLPIQYALTYPQRLPTPPAQDPLPEALTLYPPDIRRFPALELAYQAGRLGGLAPAVLAAADEVVVGAFLNGQITFTQIPQIISLVLAEAPSEPLSWDMLREADAWARIRAAELIWV